MKRLISPKLQRSARGAECCMNVASVCNYNPETSVLAHVQVDGGKMGGKTHDVSAVIACSACHEWLDQHKGSELDELFYTRRGMIKTLLYWISEELVVIK